MSRGIQEALDQLALNCEQARLESKAYEAGNLRAPNAKASLDALLKSTVSWIVTTRELARDNDTPVLVATEGQARAVQEEPDDGKTCAACPVPGQPHSWPGFEAPTSAATPQARKESRKAEQIEISFSRPQSYTLEDKTRKLRFKITVEDLLPE